jgi:hypothetical protein
MLVFFAGNFVAIGSVEPTIEVWDLDLVGYLFLGYISYLK